MGVEGSLRIMVVHNFEISGDGLVRTMCVAEDIALWCKGAPRERWALAGGDWNFLPKGEGYVSAAAPSAVPRPASGRACVAMVRGGRRRPSPLRVHTSRRHRRSCNALIGCTGLGRPGHERRCSLYRGSSAVPKGGIPTNIGPLAGAGTSSRCGSGSSSTCPCSCASLGLVCGVIG